MHIMQLMVAVLLACMASATAAWELKQRAKTPTSALAASFLFWWSDANFF